MPGLRHTLGFFCLIVDCRMSHCHFFIMLRLFLHISFHWRAAAWYTLPERAAIATPFRHAPCRFMPCFTRCRIRFCHAYAFCRRHYALRYAITPIFLPSSADERPRRFTMLAISSVWFTLYYAIAERLTPLYADMPPRHDAANGARLCWLLPLPCRYALYCRFELLMPLMPPRAYSRLMPQSATPPMRFSPGFIWYIAFSDTYATLDAAYQSWLRRLWELAVFTVVTYCCFSRPALSHVTLMLLIITPPWYDTNANMFDFRRRFLRLRHAFSRRCFRVSCRAFAISVFIVYYDRCRHVSLARLFATPATFFLHMPLFSRHAALHAHLITSPLMLMPPQDFILFIELVWCRRCFWYRHIYFAFDVFFVSSRFSFVRYFLAFVTFRHTSRQPLFRFAFSPYFDGRSPLLIHAIFAEAPPYLYFMIWDAAICLPAGLMLTELPITMLSPCLHIVFTPFRAFLYAFSLFIFLPLSLLPFVVIVFAIAVFSLRHGWGFRLLRLRRVCCAFFFSAYAGFSCRRFRRVAACLRRRLLPRLFVFFAPRAPDDAATPATALAAFFAEMSMMMPSLISWYFLSPHCHLALWWIAHLFHVSRDDELAAMFTLRACLLFADACRTPLRSFALAMRTLIFHEMIRHIWGSRFISISIFRRHLPPSLCRRFDGFLCLLAPRYLRRYPDAVMPRYLIVI